MCFDTLVSHVKWFSRCVHALFYSCDTVSAGCLLRQCVTFERMTHWRQLFAFYLHFFARPVYFFHFEAIFQILLYLCQFTHLSRWLWPIVYIHFVNALFRSPTFSSSHSQNGFAKRLSSRDNCMSNYAADIEIHSHDYRYETRLKGEAAHDSPANGLESVTFFGYT